MKNASFPLATGFFFSFPSRLAKFVKWRKDKKKSGRKSVCVCAGWSEIHRWRFLDEIRSVLGFLSSQPLSRRVLFMYWLIWYAIARLRKILYFISTTYPSPFSRYWHSPTIPLSPTSSILSSQEVILLSIGSRGSNMRKRPMASSFRYIHGLINKSLVRLTTPKTLYCYSHKNFIKGAEPFFFYCCRVA